MALVPVPVGPPRQIYGALSSNSVIRNLDTANAVWIGTGPNIGPMVNAVKLPAFGSMTWINDKAQVYSCVDTGVATQVLLDISEDISALSDPLGTAIATQQQLYASGVPLVYTRTLLFNATLPASLASTGFLPGNQYASLLVIGSAVGSVPNSWNIQVVDNDISSNPIANLVGIGNNFRMIIPTNGAPLKFTNIGDTTVGLEIYGTNQPAQSVLFTTDQASIRSLQLPATTVWTSGTAQTLVSLDTGINYTQLNGQCTLFVDTGPGLTGFLGFRYIDQNTPRTFHNILMPPTLAAGSHNQFTLNHPRSSIQWVFYPTASVTTYVNLYIFSGNAGGE